MRSQAAREITPANCDKQEKKQKRVIHGYSGAVHWGRLVVGVKPGGVAGGGGVFQKTNPGGEVCRKHPEQFRKTGHLFHLQQRKKKSVTAEGVYRALSKRVEKGVRKTELKIHRTKQVPKGRVPGFGGAQRARGGKKPC